VSAPTRYQVAGTGRALGTSPGTDGATVHRFSAEAVRDVAVTVGRLTVQRYDMDGVRLYVVAPHGGTTSPLATWAQRIDEASETLVELLGPFPYENLWVTIQPYESAGIELSGAILFGDLNLRRDGWLVGHELAHMWFYGLVGNNQGRDPWLDESFASFAQALADGGEDGYPWGRAVASDGPAVGAPMTTWARLGQDAYEDAVYERGAAALLEGRRRVDTERFDDALRRYLHTHAHQIATPADVEQAFADLPEVLALLREVGALTS
jgi:Peptidase family M1 domain